MKRSLWILALLAATPLTVAAQQSADRMARATGAPVAQEQVFRAALDHIRELHLEQQSDSVLWANAWTGVVALADSATAERLRSIDPHAEGAFLQALDSFETPGEEVTDSALWANALTGVIRGLQDPYAEIIPPTAQEEFVEQNYGNYAGIGVQITELNDRVTITAVFRSTPAFEAGLQEGDVIVEVDGHDSREWSSATASDSIRGPEGTPVVLGIEREGFGQPLRMELRRAEVHVSAVVAGFLPDSIGYVALDRFARNAAQEVDSAIHHLRGARGIIFDLRRNPGGFLDESLILSDVFLPSGVTLAQARGRTPQSSGRFVEEAWQGRFGARLDPRVPLVILVDRFTASAAEIVAGALQDHDRALIVGERTFGKGVMQTLLRLPQDHQLRLTTGFWMTPLGRSLHRPRETDGSIEEGEDAGETPVFQTASGRTLEGGGGVYPDLEIPNDTLRLREREFLQAAADGEVPLGLRIAEVAFARAQELRGAERNSITAVNPTVFRTLLEALAEDGVASEFLDDPVVKDYLHWRLRISTAQRLEDEGAVAFFRSERDPVLAEAMRLAQQSRVQGDLFRVAAQERAERERRAEEAETAETTASGAAGSESGSGSGSGAG